MVIEQVTGHTLQQELTTRILGPLGLNRTSYPADVTLPAPFASGYGRLDPDEPLLDLTLSSPSSSAGSGGIVSTLADLAVFGQALGSGRLLQPASQTRRLQFVGAGSGGRSRVRRLRPGHWGAHRSRPRADRPLSGDRGAALVPMPLN